LKEEKRSGELREMLGLEAVSLVMMSKGRLNWFEHVQCRDAGCAA